MPIDRWSSPASLRLPNPRLRTPTRCGNGSNGGSHRIAQLGGCPMSKGPTSNKADGGRHFAPTKYPARHPPLSPPPRDRDCTVISMTRRAMSHEQSCADWRLRPTGLAPAVRLQPKCVFFDGVMQLHQQHQEKQRRKDVDQPHLKCTRTTNACQAYRRFWTQAFKKLN
jgi:hypothetical protein